MKARTFLALWVLLGAVAPLRGELVYEEGFESYPVGSIHGQHTTWIVDGGTITGQGRAEVVSDQVYAGNRALGIDSTPAGCGGYWKGCIWYDDTATAPHGGLLELSWQMRTKIDPWWEISVGGWNGNQVCTIRNYAAYGVGSPTTVDVETSEGWIETMAMLPAQQWRRFELQVDFAPNPDRYRFRVSSGNWYPTSDADSSKWYTLGTDEQYFRWIHFAKTNSWWDVFDYHVDDLRISAVPEPCTFVLLLTAGVAIVVCSWWRRRHAPYRLWRGEKIDPASN